MASEALDFTLATAGPVDVGNLRLAWIKNTSTLWEMFVSKALQAAAEGKKRLSLEGEAFELTFDAEGNLIRP